jgi:hypothetical protein
MAPSLNQAAQDRRCCNCRQWVLSLMGPAPTPAAGPACGWGEAAWTGIPVTFWWVRGGSHSGQQGPHGGIRAAAAA